MQDNILGNEERERAAYGHVVHGIKDSGKEFLAKLAYAEGDSLVFITRHGDVIKNQRRFLVALKVVV